MITGDFAKWFDVKEVLNGSLGNFVGAVFFAIVVLVMRAFWQLLSRRRHAVDTSELRTLTPLSRDPLRMLEPIAMPVGEYVIYVAYSWIASFALSAVCIGLALSGGWCTVAGWLLAIATTVALWFVVIRLKRRESDRWWPVCITLSVVTFFFAWGMVLATSENLPPA